MTLLLQYKQHILSYSFTGVPSYFCGLLGHNILISQNVRFVNVYRTRQLQFTNSMISAISFEVN